MGRTVWLAVGLLGGALITLAFQYAYYGQRDTPRAKPPDRGLLDVWNENERLKTELAAAEAQARDAQRRSEDLTMALERAEAGAAPRKERSTATGVSGTPQGPLPTDAEILEAVGAFGRSLDRIVLGGAGAEKARADLRAVLDRAGPEAVDLLVAKFVDNATDIQMRVAMAHALAQCGKPEGIAALAKMLEDPQTGMLELRFASHGLAFSDAPGIDDTLLAVARRTADTGARANAAFGLARRKNAEGLALYLKATDEAMANRDPAALQYLGGLTLLGDEVLPPLRERLLTYTEPQAAITLIEIVKAKGDRGSLDNLRKLAADLGRDASIRKAAEGAIKAIGSTPK